LNYDIFDNTFKPTLKLLTGLNPIVPVVVFTMRNGAAASWFLWQHLFSIPFYSVLLLFSIYVSNIFHPFLHLILMSVFYVFISLKV